MGKLLKIDPVVIENESYPYSGKTHFGHDPGSGRTHPLGGTPHPMARDFDNECQISALCVLATSSFFLMKGTCVLLLPCEYERSTMSTTYLKVTE